MVATLELYNFCTACLTYNGSVYYFLFALFVAYFGISFEKKTNVGIEKHFSPDRGKFSIPQNSINAKIIGLIASKLSPYQYIQTIKCIVEYIKEKTKINQRSFLKNIFIFFIFYYMIVSPLAVMMIPTNYSATSYTKDALIALFLMMLTNAIGDVISFKITFRNLKKIYKYYKNTKINNDNFSSSIKFELKLYLITIIDILLALSILIIVLILTSVYFGASIGEYKFEFSMHMLEGSYNRLTNFWTTCLEPYWFRKDIISSPSNGLPMLLIYSFTSFIPSIIILLISLIWTFTLPLRFIYYSDMSKVKKVFISEGIVIVMCSIGMYVYDKISLLSIVTLYA